MPDEVWQLSPEARLVHPDDTTIFIIYGQQSGIQCELNEIAFKIIKMISAQPTSIQFIKDAIINEYQITPEAATSDIIELLCSLEANGLIQRR